MLHGRDEPKCFLLTGLKNDLLSQHLLMARMREKDSILLKVNQIRFILDNFKGLA